MRHLIVCVVIAIGQVPPSSPQRPARDPTAGGTVKEGTAVIRGRVTDAETGQPLERMVVTALSPDLQRVDRTWTRQAVTDAQGRYELAKLPASAYYIQASAGEFKVWYLAQSYGAPPSSTPVGQMGKRLELADGEVRQGMDFTLTRALAITGRVTDEFGDPLANIVVAAERQGRRTYSGMSDRTTDDRGAFRVFGLAPGEYRVCAAPRSSPMNNPQERPIRTCYPSATDDAEAQLVKLTTADVGEIEIRLMRGRTYSISGGVVSAGGPLADVQVGLSRIERNGSSGSSVEMKSDGQFVARGLTAGQYVVQATRRRGVNVQDFTVIEAGSASVRIDNADVEDVTVVMSPSATVRGRVTFEDSPAPASAGKMMVTVAFDRLSGSISFGPPPSAVVKDDMTFELTPLFGSQMVTSGNYPRGWNLKAVRYNGNDITDLPTEFKTGGGLEIVLSTRAAELSGRILDDSGAALAECQCQVFVFSIDPRRWKNRLSTTAIAPIDKDGIFKLRGRRDGEYFIAAVPYDYPIYDLDDAQFAALAKVAERVTLQENERRTMDLHVVKVPQD